MRAISRIDLIVDPGVFLTFYIKWKQWREQKKKIEAGDVVRQAVQTWGLSESVIRNKFNRLLAGESVFSAIQPKKREGVMLTAKRKKSEEIARKIAVAKIATETQSKTKYMSTEFAANVLVNEGILSPNEIPSRSTMDRWLKKNGLRVKDFKKAPTAVQLYADPCQAFAVDATPLDQHFLSLDNMFKYMPRLSEADKHRSEILHREGLRKIWLFFAVDMYSHAWFCRAYAPEGGGEDTATWIEFLTDLFLPKQDIPFHGIPKIIYCDRGSGLQALETIQFLTRVGPVVETHIPGNARAKGIVEGRISSAKRSHETGLKTLENNYLDLNLLNEFYTKWQIYHNTEGGMYAKFTEGTKSKPLPIVTVEDIRNARVSHVKRTLDAYGCVSVQWGRKGQSQKYFVGRDLPRGLELHIYKDLTGIVTAFDPLSGKKYNCDVRGNQKVKMGGYKKEHDYDWKETVEETRRKEVKDEAKKFKPSFKSLLPPEVESREYDGKTVKQYVPDPTTPLEFESVGDAISALEDAVGEIGDELLPEIIKSFSAILEKKEVISFHDLRKYIEVLKKEE